MRFLTSLCVAILLSSSCSPRKPTDASLLQNQPGSDFSGSDLYAVRHVNPEEVRFAPQGDIEAGIEAALATADKTLDVAMYSLSDASLLERLQELASTVRIRLLLNQARTCGSKCESLEAAGVDIRYVNPIMHHKFAIIDGAQTGEPSQETILITGSANWSSSAFSIYDEDWLRYDGNYKLMRAFQVEFNRLWDHSRDFEGPATSDSSVTVEIGSSPANVAFTSANFTANAAPGSYSADSEGDAVMSKIVAAIDFAKSSVKVAHAHFRIERIYAALLRAHQRGVVVQIILDQQEYRNPEYESDPSLLYEEQLASAGVAVRYKTYALRWNYRTAKQMHLKTIIVDNQWVLTGSYNLSRNAERGTFENIVGIKKESIVSAYAEKFAALWDLGSGTYEPLLDNIRQAEGQGPCNFPPVSLTPDQLQQLRDQFADDAC